MGGRFTFSGGSVEGGGKGCEDFGLTWLTLLGVEWQAGRDEESRDGESAGYGGAGWAVAVEGCGLEGRGLEGGDGDAGMGELLFVLPRRSL